MLSHFALMTIYALQISVFFALLWRRSRPGQLRLFAQLFAGMMVGGLLVSWIMYAVPWGPAAPFPN